MIINDYYKILGISPKASLDELRRAYRNLARQYHPDTGSKANDDNMFALISEAYSVLSDPVKRNQYNKENGYPFFEEVDLGEGTPQTEESKNTEAADNGRPTGKTEIKAGMSWDNLRGHLGAHDLKVGHKVALTSEEELERIKREEEEAVGAWGDDEADSFHPTGKGGRGILSIFRRKSNEAARRKELKEKMRRELDEQMHPMRPVMMREAVPREEVESRVEPIRSPVLQDRIFQFQITSFEQAIGTKREIALPGRPGEDPRRIPVSIPAGVENGEILEVAQGWERVNVKISVVQDPYVRVHGSDVLLRFPVTIGEAARTKELRVPTAGGSMVVRISPPESGGNRIRLEGKGLEQEGSSVQGDMVVFPQIILPKSISPLVQAAVDTIERHYSQPVRSIFEQDPRSPTFWFPDGEDAVVLLPVTLGEAVRGVSVSISLPTTSVEVEIPGGWNFAHEKLLEGALINEQGDVGDLIVVPFIALPTPLNAEVLGAADSIDAAYTSAVRADMPGRLAQR